MSKLDVDKLLKVLEIQQRKEMLTGGSASFSVKGKKGDGIKDVTIQNGDLVVTLSVNGSDVVKNLGKVVGEKGQDADEQAIQNRIETKLNAFIEKEQKRLTSLVPSQKEISLEILDEIESKLPDMVREEVLPVFTSLRTEKADIEAIRGQLEALTDEAKEELEEIIKETAERLRKMAPRSIFGGGGARILGQLSDVNVDGAATGQSLVLQADGLWKPQTITGGSGGITDGDKGDITVSASGATWTIDDGAVTFAKMQHIATNRILGRSTAGTGDIEALADGDARDIMGLATTDSPQFAGINLGHPTDTTITRVSAGVIAVDGTNVSLAGHTHTANEVTLSNISGATYTNVQQMQDIFHSSGSGTGGTITDNGNGTYAVSAGTGWIRPTNDATDTLLAFNWSANASLTPSDGRNYVGVEYNAGSPQVVQRASYNWNYQTDFPLGEVVKEGAVLHVFNAQHKVGDHAGKMIEAMEDTMGFARDNRTGGIILGETGTRNLTVSAGSLWYGLTEYPITAKNTSVSDTFDYYYRDGVGGWTLVSAQTAWNNTQFDNNSGTLATMSSAKFGVHWFYIDIEANGQLVGIYGQAEYNTVADANDATLPATVPDRLQSHGRIIGRLIFQKNAATATSVESVFNTIFSSSAVVNHNNLAGLQGGTTAEYYHLTSAQLSALHDAVTVSDSAEIDFTLTGQDITASLITGSIDVLKLDSGVQTSLGLADSALQASAIGSTVQAYDADLTTWAGITPGTGVGTALAVNVGTDGAFVVKGGDAGTPSALVGTNISGTGASFTAGQATAALGLKTATTTVAISSATAPSVGQVLTATSSTAATWQTPTGGGDAWSDPVNANIVPDADGTRNLGSATNKFAELFTDDLTATLSAAAKAWDITTADTGTTGNENGAININNTANTGHALTVYTNQGASQNGPLIRLEAANAAFDKPIIEITNEGTAGSASGIRINGPRPEIEFWETDQTAPEGAFELLVNGDRFNVSGRNAGNTGFEPIMEFYRIADGGDVNLLDAGASYQVDGVDVINKTSIGGTVHQRMTAFTFNDPNQRSASEWLKVGSATFNTNEGVPMIRPGSITGISAGFEILNYVSTGTMALEVYKNGTLVWTSSTTSITGNGYYVVTDTQANGTDTFVAGDKLAVKTVLTGTFDYDDIMGVLEIEVTD